MADTAGIGVQPAGPWPTGLEGDFRSRLEVAIERAAQWLLARQAADGHWCAELEADTTLESDYIFYLYLIGQAEPERVERLARYIRARQLSDGGWNIYAGGPSELNATVKAYVALRLAGDPEDAPHLLRAAERIRALGGLENTNSFVRFYLAMAGVIGWEMVPAIPPELMLLPRWFPVNLYEMSSWTRGIVVPMMILYALRPRWSLPVSINAEALLRDPARRHAAFAWSRQPFTWRNFFLAVDRLLKLYERLPVKPFRRAGLAAAKGWMLEHLERSDGLGAIYPALVSAARWLLDRQVLGPGDWQVKCSAEPGGWAFEYRNDFYPDVDDTAFVLMALRRVEYPEPARLRGAVARGVRWLLGMQSRNGGWGAFDRDNCRTLLTYIPFADHN